MHISKKEIEALDRVKRLKIINAVSGIKSANLIGTINKKAQTNLAIFSSVVHIGSDPALLGFMMRPTADVPRNTYNNIMENELYTINHVQSSFIKNAHYTSAKFEESISEFDRCNLSEEFITDFQAPFVKESTFKMGMKLKESIHIKSNNSILIIGEIEHLILPDDSMVDNDINLEVANSIGISGLNSYYSLKKVASYPYAREKEIPNFETH
ncbi:flavin oxidoreductase [Putridiphycobacter roseus]|uniref:Flavin oxidoreductase n=1 Tax=Putridiphycobacter roseus TaxID=2219161 RepID=A0A2W1NNB6_9FLAO|nr:flavin reductase [Putridiphycobacter roseus]PZE16078.1 flavin oxidoreductase [Putridiphycobacter roseus]